MAELGKRGRLRPANGVSPPRTLAARPPLPGAWGARAGQRYTTSAVSRWLQNSSSHLAARSSRLTPPPAPSPRLPGQRGSAAPHSSEGDENVVNAVPDTSSATFHVHPCGQPFKCRLAATSPFHATPSTTCKRLGNRSVPDHTYRLLTARASRSPTPSSVSSVSLRSRGSAFWRSRPGGFREPVRLSPSPAPEYLGCLELQFPASIGPLAAGHSLRPPPPSGSRLPRFLSHLVRVRYKACFRMLSLLSNL